MKLLRTKPQNSHNGLIQVLYGTTSSFELGSFPCRGVAIGAVCAGKRAMKWWKVDTTNMGQRAVQDVL